MIRRPRQWGWRVARDVAAGERKTGGGGGGRRRRDDGWGWWFAAVVLGELTESRR